MSEGNCEGQVVLRENESSYEKWGIVIRVRFRAVEEGGILSDLSSRVQSGGERSVATIQYLMAMQVCVCVISVSGLLLIDWLS